MRRAKALPVFALLAVMSVALSVARPLDGDAAVEDAIVATAIGGPIGFEDEVLYLASDVATRTGDALRLTYAVGAAKTYASTPKCSPVRAQPNCTKFALIAFLRSRGAFVLAKLQSDATTFLVVDAKTGRETTLRAAPLLSPDGRLLLEHDPRATNAPPVRVLRRRGDVFVPEWTGTLAGDGSVATFEVLKWSSNHSVAFKKSVWRRTTDPAFSSPLSRILPTQVDVMVELRRATARWSVSDETPLPRPQAQYRWNWRTVWVSHQATPVNPYGEPNGVADVIFGQNTIKITGLSLPISLTGRINANGDIRGASSVMDGGAALMIGRYDASPLFPDGHKPQCLMEEIQLRDSLKNGRPLPNGSVTILVKQLPEDCSRGLPEGHGEGD